MNITPLAQLALLFSTLLLPGTQALLAPTTPDAGSALNLTFDPWTRTLTWACDTAAGNVTVTSCTVTSREAGIHRRVSPFGCRCWFRRMMALHHGVTLDVNGTVGGAAAHWRLSFVNEGAAGSGAENLTCEIRAARFLSCAWREGPAAPADVRYSLRVLNSTGHDVARCMADPGDDVITQCIANDLSLLGSEAYLVVTGRSGAGPVRFLDDVVATKALERLDPPRDVTASCNSSHCTVSWAPPSTWASLTARDFQFEVQWQVGGASPSWRGLKEGRRPRARWPRSQMLSHAPIPPAERRARKHTPEGARRGGDPPRLPQPRPPRRSQGQGARGRHEDEALGRMESRPSSRG